MKQDSSTIVVRILDKDYQVACPPDQRLALIDAAQHLDRQMRGIRESGKVFGLERIAVMTALNLSHELLRVRTELEQRPKDMDSSSRDQLRQLLSKADAALSRLRQIEID